MEQEMISDSNVVDGESEQMKKAALERKKEAAALVLERLT